MRRDNDKLKTQQSDNGISLKSVLIISGAVLAVLAVLMTVLYYTLDKTRRKNANLAAIESMKAEQSGKPTGFVYEYGEAREADFTYETAENGTARITGYKGADAIVAIPETLGGKTVTELAGWTFYDNDAVRAVRIPSGVTSVEKSAFYSVPSLRAIDIADGNTAYRSVDGVLYTSDGKRLVRYPEGCPDKSYTVPNGAEVIGEDAFSLCTNLTSVTLPEGVLLIDDHAFSMCMYLETVTLPDSLVRIGEGAFAMCGSLTQTDAQDLDGVEVRNGNEALYGTT